MPDTLQYPAMASYKKEYRRIDEFPGPAIVIPVKNRLWPVAPGQNKPTHIRNPGFEEWNLPPQESGYIRCGRHDFL